MGKNPLNSQGEKRFVLGKSPSRRQPNAREQPLATPTCFHSSGVGSGGSSASESASGVTSSGSPCARLPGKPACCRPLSSSRSPERRTRRASSSASAGRLQGMLEERPARGAPQEPRRRGEAGRERLWGRNHGVGRPAQLGGVAFSCVVAGFPFSFLVLRLRVETI